MTVDQGVSASAKFSPNSVLNAMESAFNLLMAVAGEIPATRLGSVSVIAQAMQLKAATDEYNRDPKGQASYAATKIKEAVALLETATKSIGVGTPNWRQKALSFLTFGRTDSHDHPAKDGWNEGTLGVEALKGNIDHLKVMQAALETGEIDVPDSWGQKRGLLISIGGSSPLGSLEEALSDFFGDILGATPGAEATTDGAESTQPQGAADPGENESGGEGSGEDADDDADDENADESGDDDADDAPGHDSALSEDERVDTGTVNA